MSSLSKIIFKDYYLNKSITALRIDDKGISYQELFDKSLKVASILLKRGASSETVAIVGSRSFSTYIGILGILFSGCSYTPINPRTNKSKILEILIDSKIKHYVGEYSAIKLILEIVKDEDDIVKNIKSLITPLDTVDDKSINDISDYKDIEEAESLQNPIKANKSDLAYILYTSGSTGKPKGVQVTISNLCSYLASISTLWNIPPGFRMSQFHDLSFDPSVSDIFYTFSNKGTLCVVPEKEMMHPSDFIKRENLDIWSSVPSIGIFMSKMGVLSPKNFPSLKFVRFAGEPLDRSIADQWQEAAPNASVENHYGPTEATIDVSRHVYSIDQKDIIFNNNIVPIGQPFPGMEIKIIDTEDNLIEINNVKGEIIFSGPQITNGYLNDKEKTRKSFVYFSWDKCNRIWYKSGDLGFININNNFECAGRKDNQIKISGRRIEIGEIEYVLSRFKKTKNTIVVALKDKFNNISGCMGFTTHKITKEEILEIRKESKNYLDPVFFPKNIISIDTFPKSESGKINRKKLETMAKES